jgi:Flp pilus assembly protein TadD
MVGAAAARALAAPLDTRRIPETPWDAYTRLSMDDVYDLFKRGTALLEAGDFNSATVPLSKAAAIEPEKTSIREALGRAYFRSRQFEEARVEFEAVVERAPTNDYALFCLGRALLALGRPREARKPLALAAQLRPERRDYRIYRERAAKAA